MSAPTLRSLPVDVEELAIALDVEGADLRWYFDGLTGDVLLVNHDYRPSEHDGLTVEDIERDAQRFIRIPGADGQHLDDDMRAFVSSLADPRLQESLALALSASRPERRFKTALSWLPDTLEEWHAWRKERCHQRALQWLAGLGVVPSARAA